MGVLNMKIRSILDKAPIIAQAKSLAGVRLILDVCSPPYVKYPLKCIVFVIQTYLAIRSGGLTNITSVAL